MFKKLSAILILFCFTFISSIKAQNNKIDSLKKLLIVSNSDSNKVNLLNKLTDQFMQLRDSSNTFNYYNQSIALAQKVNFAKGIVSAYRIISIFYYNSTQYNKAIEFSSKSLELSKQLGDKLEESRNLTNMSFSYRELGNFKKAVYYAIEGITLNKCIKNYKGLAACYNTIAIINQTQGNTKKALIFYKMAINLPKSALSPKNKSSLLGNIGVLYRDQKQYDSAMIYFNIAEKIGISSKNEKDLPSIYSNIGECYYVHNHFSCLRWFTRFII